MRRRLVRGACCWRLCAPAGADLSEVPEPWTDRIVPIPEQRLAELEAASVARIRETRSRLDDDADCGRRQRG